MTKQSIAATEEPWGALHRNTGKSRAVVDKNGYEFGVAVSSKRAQRIIACINACAGVPTWSLEEAVKKYPDTKGRFIFLTAIVKYWKY